MTGYRLNLFLLVLVAGILAIAWFVGRDKSQPNYEFTVEGQMGHSPAYDSFAPNPNFPDGLTLRQPPAGTIAQGHRPFPYKATSEDAVRAGQELGFPPIKSKEDEAHRKNRGMVVFANYCQVCHGPFGQGDGPVTQGGFPPPPSLVAERALRMPVGQMFHVLTYGQGRMPSIAPQLSPDDRWNAILHVRQLQRYNVPSESKGPVTLAGVTLVFRQNCSACHGEDGTGSAQRKILPNIPDFTSLAWQVSQTEMAIVNQIDYGSLPLMPAFRYKLTREEIQGLAVYIRSFPSRQTGPPAPIKASLTPVALYQNRCFICHDSTGRGNPLMRQSMPLPDFTDPAWQKSRTDEDLSHSILEGKASPNGKFMLSMKQELGPVNVKEMVALVRGFKGGKQKIEPATAPLPGPPAPEKGTAKPPDIKVVPPKELPKMPVPSGDLAARIRVGAVLFRQFCIVCHGPDGTGSPMRATMRDIPNFTDPAWQKKKLDAELLNSIWEGKGAFMPANSGRITRDQAKDLLAYIRAFGPARVNQGPVEDDEFGKKFRQLQQQYDALEKKLQELKGQRGK